MRVRIELESAVSGVATRVGQTTCAPVLGKSSGLNSILGCYIISIASLVIQRHRECCFARRRRETLSSLKQSSDIVATKDGSLSHFLSDCVGDNFSCANKMRLVIVFITCWICLCVRMSNKFCVTSGFA